LEEQPSVCRQYDWSQQIGVGYGLLMLKLEEVEASLVESVEGLFK
jgi:hypothetical protein